MEDFEFRLREPSSSVDEVTLRVYLSSTNFSREVYLNKKDLLYRQQQLTQRLFDFTRSGYQMAKLKLLAKEGYQAFCTIDAVINQEFRTQWEKQFLCLLPRKNKIIIEAHDKRGLHVTFPNGYSFPFGLLFTKDPDSILWNDTPINHILIYFFDLKFRIRNSIDPIAFKDGAVIPDTILKESAPIKVIHAINNKFSTAIEESCWTLDNDIVRVLAYDTNQLLDSWHTEEFPRIIHFSNVSRSGHPLANISLV